MLVLDSSARKRIKTIKQHAEQFPLPADAVATAFVPRDWDEPQPHERAYIRQLRAFIKNCTIDFGSNYFVTYTYEEHRFGLARHLVVSMEGTPEPAVIRLLMEEFGFRMPFGKCLHYEEKFGKKGVSQHIIEAEDPFSAAFQAELNVNKVYA